MSLRLRKGAVTHQIAPLALCLQDYSDAEELLAPANVDPEALRLYAHDAAHFSTGGKMPDLQFAQNHAGQPDVAMFDFTCMQRAENASLVRERRGKKLLMGLVGDCLVEVRGSIFRFSEFTFLATQAGVVRLLSWSTTLVYGWKMHSRPPEDETIFACGATCRSK